jgi:Fic family protein
MNTGLGTQQKDRRDGLSRVTLLRRIRAEFAEMPGLRLTRDQAMRLWSLPEETCERLLGELERTGFLRRLDNGAYGRPDLGA